MSSWSGKILYKQFCNEEKNQLVRNEIEPQMRSFLRQDDKIEEVDCQISLRARITNPRYRIKNSMT